VRPRGLSHLFVSTGVDSRAGGVARVRLSRLTGVEKLGARSIIASGAYPTRMRRAKCAAVLMRALPPCEKNWTPLPEAAGKTRSVRVVSPSFTKTFHA
jgi:hypothetical protein